MQSFNINFKPKYSVIKSPVVKNRKLLDNIKLPEIHHKDPQVKVAALCLERRSLIAKPTRYYAEIKGIKELKKDF